MEFKDYYKVLGVERSADQKAISQAFRRLARQYHPDVNKDPGAAERFKEINEAYQALGDPEKRAKYDQLLDLHQRGGHWEDLLRRGAGRDGGTYTVYGAPEDLGEFSEFFQQLFGDLGGGLFGGMFGPGGARRGPGRRGGARGRAFDLDDLPRRGAAGSQDAAATLELGLEEAFHGGRRTVVVPAADGGERRLEVTIPPGVRDGQRLRLAGQGPGGGDLYLTVRLRPHPVFTLQGDDLGSEVAVPVWVAALGGEVAVPTLRGPVRMRIPAGTQGGRTFRLRGQGMPRAQGGAGDQLVKVRLALPEPLTPRDRELFDEVRRQHEAHAART